MVSAILSPTDELPCYSQLSVNDHTPASMLLLMADRKWLLLCAKSLLDDVLTVFPELPGILDTKAVIEHILDLLQAETRDFRVKEVYTPPLALEHTDKARGEIYLQMRTQPMPQMAA